MNNHNNAFLPVKNGSFEFECMPVSEAWQRVKNSFGFTFMIFAGQRFDFFDGNEFVEDRETVFEMFTQRKVS